MRPFFALPAVRAGDVSDEVASRFGADASVFPCCVTLPMGWSHSVLVAQIAHKHLPNTRTNLRPSDHITEHTDSIVDRLLYQVYIDDLNFYGRIVTPSGALNQITSLPSNLPVWW